jgi:proline dehydrogenase
MINRMIAELLPHLPKRFIWVFSKKYIAGETIDDAVRVVSELNAGKMLATIDILGESIDNPAKAQVYFKQYLDTIERAALMNLKTTFSLKPSMFGLLWDFDFCYKLIRQIVQKASNYGMFVRLDMEDARCTQLELNLFKKLYAEFNSHVGIVLQACLRRTIDDIAFLKEISSDERPVNIRLCKGIYDEHKSISYKTREEIRCNFLRCLEYILANNLFAAIATHDKELISRILPILIKYNKTVGQFEFQMLFGVTPRLRAHLVAQGYALRVYVPYGEQWMQYSTRRLKENPRMVRDILTALIIRR